MPCMRKFCGTVCMMHRWTPDVATGRQALIGFTPVLACSPPSLVRLGWVLSTHTPLGGTWVMHTKGIWLVCMILLARLSLLAQNLARICAGLLGKMPAEPYFELPVSLSKLRRLVHFRLGSHNLPIAQGRMARPIVPRFLRRCTLCSWRALGDERHFMLQCPQFNDIRAQHADLLQDARDSMRNLMWQQDQKALFDLVIAILDEPRT